MRDEADLQRLWRHQLAYVFEKAYRLDATGFRRIESAWSTLMAPVQGAGSAQYQGSKEDELSEQAPAGQQ